MTYTDMLDSNYLEQIKDGLVAKMVLEARTPLYATVVPGVKNRYSLNIVDNSSLTVGDAGCGCTPRTDLALAQKELKVSNLMIYDSICPAELEKLYLGNLMNGSKEIPFTQVFADSYVNAAKKAEENVIWNGYYNANNTPNCVSGLIYQGASCVNYSPAVAYSTSMTPAQAFAEVGLLIDKIPEDALMQEGKVIFTSFAFFNLYASYVRNANIFIQAYSDFSTPDYALTIPGTNITLVAVAPISNLFTTGASWFDNDGDNEMELDANKKNTPLLFTYKENLNIGTDLSDGSEEFEMFYSQECNSIKTRITFKIGATNRFNDRVVVGWSLAVVTP